MTSRRWCFACAVVLGTLGPIAAQASGWRTVRSRNGGFCASVPTSWKITQGLDGHGFLATPFPLGRDPAADHGVVREGITFGVMADQATDTEPARPLTLSENADREIPAGPHNRVLVRHHLFFDGFSAILIRQRFTAGGKPWQSEAILALVKGKHFRAGWHCRGRDCRRLEPMFRAAIATWRISCPASVHAKPIPPSHHR